MQQFNSRAIFSYIGSLAVPISVLSGGALLLVALAASGMSGATGGGTGIGVGVLLSVLLLVVVVPMGSLYISHRLNKSQLSNLSIFIASIVNIVTCLVLINYSAVPFGGESYLQSQNSASKYTQEWVEKDRQLKDALQNIVSANANYPIDDLQFENAELFTPKSRSPHLDFTVDIPLLKQDGVYYFGMLFIDESGKEFGNKDSSNSYRKIVSGFGFSQSGKKIDIMRDSGAIITKQLSNSSYALRYFPLTDVPNPKNLKKIIITIYPYVSISTGMSQAESPPIATKEFNLK